MGTSCGRRGKVQAPRLLASLRKVDSGYASSVLAVSRQRLNSYLPPLRQFVYFLPLLTAAEGVTVTVGLTAMKEWLQSMVERQPMQTVVLPASPTSVVPLEPLRISGEQA